MASQGRTRLPAGERLLPLLIGAGAAAGILCGWFVGPPMRHVQWVGEFFLVSLKMIIVPLVVTTMVVGIGALGDVRRIGRTGAYTLGYYMTTTGVAVLIGIVAVVLLAPGLGVDIAGVEVPERVRGKAEFTISDFVLSFVHPNIVGAMAETKLLPVILFSLLFGGIATTLGAKGKLLFDVFDAANDAILKLVGLILWLAPVGIFGLIAGRLGEAGGSEGVLEILRTLGKYSLTVIVGLGVHAFVVLPSLLWFVAGRSPLAYAKGVAEALISAFSTASSSATLPITLRCVEERNGVRAESASFVLPLGATINMDGTALYEAVAAIFIAQAWGIPIGGFNFVLIFLTATLASIGAAGIPEAGLVTMVIVLEAVGLPIEGIGLILAIDWFLDRCRTTVNVWGDSIGAAVVEKLAFRREARA